MMLQKAERQVRTVNRTRELIVDSFLQLLEEMPYDKITVRSLIERCKISRNTFYYHFHDIPELLEVTAREWVDQLIETNFRPDSPADCLRPLVEYANTHRNTVLHLYRAADRDAYLQALDRLWTYTVRRYMDSATVGLSIPPRDRLFLERYYKCTMVGVTLDWLESRMSYDLMEAAVRVCDLLAGSSQRAFLKCAEEGKD